MRGIEDRVRDEEASDLTCRGSGQSGRRSQVCACVSTADLSISPSIAADVGADSPGGEYALGLATISPWSITKLEDGRFDEEANFQPAAYFHIFICIRYYTFF